MTECSGSSAIINQRTVINQTNPMDSISAAYRQRRIVQQELRKNALIAKGNEEGLSNSEAMELAGYRIQDGLEKLAQFGSPSICYMA